ERRDYSYGQRLTDSDTAPSRIGSPVPRRGRPRQGAEGRRTPRAARRRSQGDVGRTPGPRPPEVQPWTWSGDAVRAPRDDVLGAVAMTQLSAAQTAARTAQPAKSASSDGSKALYGGKGTRRITVRDIALAKERGEKWPM